MKTEQKIYKELYSRQRSGQFLLHYGHSNHGRRFVHRLIHEAEKHGSAFGAVLDVGCGHNEFAKELRRNGISAVGMDFACESADVLGDIADLKWEDDFFEWVTAFDVLEHLLPEEVEHCLSQLRRVSRFYCFTIAHRPSQITLDGRNLHPTVWPRNKWTEVLEAFSHSLSDDGTFIVGYWNK